MPRQQQSSDVVLSETGEGVEQMCLSEDRELVGHVCSDQGLRPLGPRENHSRRTKERNAGTHAKLANIRKSPEGIKER